MYLNRFRNLLTPLLLAALILNLPGAGHPARAQNAAAADSQRIALLGQMGGPVRDAVALPDGSILAAEGESLVWFNGVALPDPATRTDLHRGAILDLALSGSTILALTEQGLLSLSMLIESGPTVISFAPGGGQALDVRGDLAVIAAREAGLRAVLLTPDGALTPLAELPLEAGNAALADALDVAISPDSTRAYVAAGESGVLVVDLSDPGVPRLLGTLSSVAPVEAVTVVGSLVAVASQGRVLAVDPASGDVIGVYASIRDAKRIAIQGDFAYVADATTGLKILYLAAPDRPVQVFGESGTPVNDVLVDGDLIYLAGADSLRILNASSRFRPLEVGHVDLPGTPQGLATDVGSGRVFVALGEEGIAVVDASNLASPRLVRRIPLSGPARDVLYDGNVLYTATGEAGIAMITAPPGEETLLTTFALPGPANDLAMRGNVLYVAAGGAGLLALDVTRPATPTLIGVLALEPLRSDPDTPPREALSVTLSGKRAYVSTGDGFLVADISHPSHLTRLTRVDTPSDQVGVGSTYLYSIQGNQVTIYDARATAEPVYLRTYRGLASIAHLTARDDLVFATHADSGPDLAVLSFMAPDSPVETDNEGETGYTSRVSLADSLVWLSAGFGGLRRYELTEGDALIPRGSALPAVDASVLALDHMTLLSGGRAGWAALAVNGGALHPLARSPDVTSVHDLALSGTLAAVAAGGQGVALYDLSEPISPRLLARQEAPGQVTAVALDERFVYAGDADGLSILDQRYMQPVTRVRMPAPVSDLAVEDSLAYAALLDGSLAVVDLADPTGGISIRHSVRTGRSTDLILSPDGRLYGLAGDEIMLLNADDLNRLSVLAEGTLPQLAERGWFIGSLLAAFAPDNALRFYDVSTPEAGIAWRGEIDLAAIQPNAQDVALSGRIAYVAYGESGLGLIDSIAPARGTIFFPEEVRSLLLNEGTLFAVGETLTAWDVTHPEAPRLAAALPLVSPGRHLDIASDGSLLVSMEDGISLARWDGETLSEAGHLVAGPIDRAARIGSRVYAALHHGGLLVADFSDPSQPTGLFTYIAPSGQFAYDLLAWDESTLLVSWEGGIDVLDIAAETAAPRLLEVIPSGAARAFGVALADNPTLAALALGAEGVRLFDLSDPARPILSGVADTPGEAIQVAFGNQELFVADGRCGLRVFDLATLEEVGYWSSGYASDIAFGSDTIYLGGGTDLWTLRYDPTMPAVPPPVAQSPSPQDGRADVPLDMALSWGPPPDLCNPLIYDVFFGVAETPPFIGQVTGDPILAVELAPLRTYHWRVEATDRQGDRVRGPIWHFTTVAAAYDETLPPAPPVFAERLSQNPAIPLVLITAFAGVALAVFLQQRARRPRTEETILFETPEWHSTDKREEL